jgi:hypothetical protein
VKGVEEWAISEKERKREKRTERELYFWAIPRNFGGTLFANLTALGGPGKDEIMSRVELPAGIAQLRPL